jgi:hypothetical protein
MNGDIEHLGGSRYRWCLGEDVSVREDGGLDLREYVVENKFWDS